MLVPAVHSGCPAFSGSYDGLQGGPAVMQRDTVVEGHAGGALSLDDFPEDRFAFRQNVAMNGDHARQKPESGLWPGGVGGAVRNRSFEPADRPGADAGQYDAALPRRPQYAVDAVSAPNRHRADQVAAADVDEVLLKQVPVRALLGALLQEQGGVGQPAATLERAIEAFDELMCVAAWRGEEANTRGVLPYQVQRVVVERLRPDPIQEPTAADGDDVGHAPV